MTAFPGCIQLLFTIFSKVQIVTSNTNVHYMWEAGLFPHFCSEAGCKRETYHQSQVLPFFRNFSTVPTFQLKNKNQNAKLPVSRESEAEEAGVKPQDSKPPMWWLRGARGGCQLLPTTQPHRLHQPHRYAHNRGLSFHTLGANRGVTHSHWAQGGNGTSCLYCSYQQWLSGLSTTSTIEALTLQIKAFYH